MKYLAIRELVSNGDRWEEVYNTAEEANAAAKRDWERLTALEQRRNRIYAAIVRREWLSEDAVDEDTGATDWRLFDRADGFPGAFDSEDAVALRDAAKRWEGEADDDYREIGLDRIEFDAGRGCWVCPAEIDDARAELILRDGRIIANRF